MKEEIIGLLNITTSLREKYKRNFTLDGKLIGDIGEALAREIYNIELHPENTKDYDAFEIGSNKQIQIKSTMKGYFTFPFNHTPEFYLAIKITDTGNIESIYNGPGHIIRKYITDNKLKAYKNSYYSFTLNVIKQLNECVMEEDKIKMRK
jgi:hypothetical protein